MHSQMAQSSNQPCPGVSRRGEYKRRCRQERKKEFKLSAENRYLKGLIEGLISNYLQVSASSVSHSATLNVNPSFYVQDHKRVDSDLGGTDEELDGIELSDLLGDLLSDDEMKNPKNSPVIWQSRIAEFMKKIDEDVASSVDIHDSIISLDGEQKTIGKYSFPLSLVPTVERITDIYGDVSATSLMNSNVTGRIYLLFCATIKEMEDLQLSEVTEEKMLKWRDAIKDALCKNFKVDFAMEHLKRIARAYFGRIGSQLIQTIDEKVNALYEERAETYDDFKDCLADAEDFNGKPVSSGLFL